MKIQIYSAHSPEEAVALFDIGVDHVGFTTANLGLPGEIKLETGRAIAQASGKKTCVALSVSSDLDEIVSMVDYIQPDIVHLCGLEGDLLPDAVGLLRQRISIPIMQAISVAGPEAVDAALSYEPVSDFIILDTQAPDIDGIGASGMTHDWNISREIVQRVNIPVILAGGLGPENVYEAASFVRPWGVDSLTHTNLPTPTKAFRKDLALVKVFVEEAKKAVI